MAVVPFPILLLPSSALRKCLKRMSVAQLISISFLSKNTKEIIRMLERKNIHETITLTQSVTLSLPLKWLKIRHFVSKPDQILQAAKICENSVNSVPEEFCVPECTVKQFTDHIAHIFFQNEGMLLQIVNLQEDYLNDVEEYAKNLNFKDVHIDSTEMEDVPLLNFFSSVELLSVSDIRVSDLITIQNVRSLELHVVNLDDILSSNSSNIRLYCFLSNKDLNLLMKQWIKGSMPRLGFFKMSYWREREPVIQTSLFEGIDVESLKRNHMNETVCEIKRNDGTLAEITNSANLPQFRMEVTSYF